ESRIPRCQWRAVEPSSSVFVTQCFMNEVAHAAGRDAVAYQLELLSRHGELPFYGGRYAAARLAGVLRLAAGRGGWGASMATGTGRGIAASYANGAFVAHVV